MATCHAVALDARDLAEIRRSAEESDNYVVTADDPYQVERYLNPPPTTAYGLEYAFHLLGCVEGKTIVDFGCGKGENLVLLARRGAKVIGLDLSPELVGWARRRVLSAGVEADVMVASAYDTGLPDESVDVVFCIALIHHLEIPRVRKEMLRILKKDGSIILKEPIRFSGFYDRIRKLLKPRWNISEYEHPLTKPEFECMTSGLAAENLRYFRLPFVPLIGRFSGHAGHFARISSGWLLAHIPLLVHVATGVVVRLRKI
jgi:SAM-dependent methyltransferase